MVKVVALLAMTILDRQDEHKEESINCCRDFPCNSRNPFPYLNAVSSPLRLTRYLKHLACREVSLSRASRAHTMTRHEPQKRASESYQFIHTDLVGPINPVGFGGERNFFTFTDDFTRYTEVHTGAWKSDLFKYLKTFYNLCKTRSHKERPVERLSSDYGSELQSKRVEECFAKKGITFEPSAPYSQEQNGGVSERMGRTIMDMTRATILEGSLDDELWPEIVLAMTYVKNVRPTKALGGENPYNAQQKIHPDIQHFRVLGSTVYVLLREEERALKSEKWNPRALSGILVGYDGHTIYRVHIREQNKVIRIKDLRIFEDYEAKTFTELPEYKNTPTFSGFLLSDDDDEATSDTQMLDVGRKSNNATGASESTPSKVTPRKGRKVTTRDENTETRKSRPGRTIRPTQKAQDQDLRVYLSKLLDLDWEHSSEEKANAFLTNIVCDEDGHDADDDPYTIMTSRLIQANAQSKGDYVLATQLYIEEPESYNRAMQ